MSIPERQSDYIPVEAAAAILRQSERQTYRLAEKVRTKKAGRRVLFHRGDIEQLAADLNVSALPVPAPPQDVLPAGELLRYVEQLSKELQGTMARVGYLEAQLQTRLLPEDERTLRQQLTETRAEAEALKQERDRLAAAARPWYARWQVWAAATVLLFAVVVALVILLIGR